MAITIDRLVAKSENDRLMAEAARQVLAILAEDASLADTELGDWAETLAEAVMADAQLS